MLDHTDKRILEELARDGRISMKKLGEKVHLTGQATANRVAKLEDDRVIEGYTVRLNYQKLGYPVHTFITIFTKSFNHQPFFSFLEAQRPFVIQTFKNQRRRMLPRGVQIPIQRRARHVFERIEPPCEL